MKTGKYMSIKYIVKYKYILNIKGNNKGPIWKKLKNIVEYLTFL